MMTHITQVKRALKELLRNDLPLKLQLGDLEASDGVSTPRPAVFYTSDKQNPEDYPCVEIISEGSRRSPANGVQIMVHRVLVAVTVAGDDEERLGVHVERYIWAVRQVANDTLLGSETPTGPIETLEERYSMVAPRPQGFEQPFVRGGYIALELTSVE